jgi:Fe2+ transport system protein FeoA
MSQEATLTLDRLEPEQQAQILALRGAPDRLQRLREMGLLKGTTIKFIRWAPMGDPLEIELRGYKLSLRREDACLVEVALV